MEYFIIGLLVGLFSGVAVSGLLMLAYIHVQSKESATDVSVEEVDQWIEDEHVSEMDVTIPLVVKEEPKPSTVGDAEVRRRFAVLREVEDKDV